MKVGIYSVKRSISGAAPRPLVSARVGARVQTLPQPTQVIDIITARNSALLLIVPRKIIATKYKTGRSPLLLYPLPTLATRKREADNTHCTIFAV